MLVWAQHPFQGWRQFEKGWFHVGDLPASKGGLDFHPAHPPDQRTNAPRPTQQDYSGVLGCQCVHTAGHCLLLLGIEVMEGASIQDEPEIGSHFTLCKPGDISLYQIHLHSGHFYLNSRF
ncbi:hypothetical protein [Photobacterium sp.]|uniref:hypothetical protein n=1 Tax=Photobacterium sp. TaxID=660 RepID=UPI00299EF089|nr:hypothetical protein [Photobacterium sp.]MDX1303249.1 hypothetical protein [Photobacterium sp.]